MTVAVADKAHAVLGPSSWHTWGNCPGSVPLAEGIVKTTSKYAKEGTAAHALLETCLGEGFDAEDLIGRQYEVEGEVFTVDNEMADAVNSAVDIVKSYLDEGAVLQVEQTVPLAFMTGEEDAEGTCDAAIISGDGTTLTIADFKYGQGVQVYASEKEGAPNGQLAMYALGWLQKHGWMYEDVTTVRLTVIQPRCEWHDEFELTVDELRAFEAVVREAAGAVELNKQLQAGGDELDLVPGEKQCKFCNAKGICPALKSVVSQSLAIVADPSSVDSFEDLTLPKKAAAAVVNEGVTNEKLAEFMRAVPLIEEAISAARAEVERRLFAGQEIPGFYLGVGRKGARKWVDEPAAIKELTKSGRLKMADALQKKPISPTSAEKLFKERPKVWSQLAALIEQPDGKPSVCREGDKNPRFELASSVDQFADVDAPKITKVFVARTANGMVVETSDGRTIVLGAGTTVPMLKLAQVGQPVAPLEQALAAKQPALEDLMG
ncbi:MAG: DUF2800 domain-containing protein [Sphingomicrobium sp.]